MFIEFSLAILAGIIFGICTGLIPGIHVNLITLILVSSLIGLESFSAIILAVFVTSLAITHTFIDFIPSVFLGAPEEDTFLSVLPGHQMLKDGKAHEAIVLTLYGSLAALLIILVFTPLFIYLIPIIYNLIKLILPFILIFISSYLILREKDSLLAFSVFSLAGILGYLSLNLPVREPLLPLLTGLFGTSAIIISLKNKFEPIQQEIVPIKKIKISKNEFSKSIIGSIFSAPLCSFLPGIGSGHAAVLGSEILKQSQRGFLVLLGAINTIVMGLSFITIYSIGRTRTGAAVAIKELLKEITFQDLTLIILTIIISGILSFFVALNISKFSAKYITKINYQTVSILVLILLLLVTIIFSNLLGILIFLIATSLGTFTILSGARRINLMGCLLIPTILLYLF